MAVWVFWHYLVSRHCGHSGFTGLKAHSVGLQSLWTYRWVCRHYGLPDMISLLVLLVYKHYGYRSWQSSCTVSFQVLWVFNIRDFQALWISGYCETPGTVRLRHCQPPALSASRHYGLLGTLGFREPYLSKQYKFPKVVYIQKQHSFPMHCGSPGSSEFDTHIWKNERFIMSSVSGQQVCVSRCQPPCK